MPGPSLKKRNQRRINLLKIFFFTVLISTKATVVTPYCGRFHFPTLTSNPSVTATEHSLVTLPFTLQTDRCSENRSQEHFIYVTAPSSDQDFCVVSLTETDCNSVVKEKHCSCADGGGAAVFTKTVTKEDGGLWSWRTGDGFAENVTVDFNILTHTSKEDPQSRTGPSLSFNDDDITRTPSVNPAYSNQTPSHLDLTSAKTNANPSPDDKTKTKKKDNENNDKANKESDHDLNKKASNEKPTDFKVVDKIPNDANDDAGDDEPLQGSVVTAMIFAGVNVITVAVVAFIVVTVKKRRKRRRREAGTVNTPERRRPNATLPLPPSRNGQRDVTASKQRHATRTLRGSNHSYQGLFARLSSRIYDEIPFGKAAERDSDGYLVPVNKQARASQNDYDVMA